jgi:two-component system LytT family sensor kinase
MEQMRFGFDFSIDIEDIDQQIEIPAMLLQPFVENAVKHGVSALKNKGLIKVSITKKDNNLVLGVQDNGKGFSDTNTAGIGIKLCEDRIKLLNSIYKNTTILLHKNPKSNGMLITIELKNWL